MLAGVLDFDVPVSMLGFSPALGAAAGDGVGAGALPAGAALPPAAAAFSVLVLGASLLGLAFVFGSVGFMGTGFFAFVASEGNPRSKVLSGNGVDLR